MSRSLGVCACIEAEIRGRGNVYGRFQRKIDRVKVKPQSAYTSAAEEFKNTEKVRTRVRTRVRSDGSTECDL